MPTGFGKIFLILFGISPVVAILLYFVYDKQHISDQKQDYNIITVQKNIADFNEDFAKDKAIHATTKEEKSYYETKSDNYGKEVATIEFEREAAKQKAIAAKRRSEAEMNALDNDVNTLSDKDFEDLN